MEKYTKEEREKITKTCELRQLTREEAIAIADSGIWKTWTDEEIVMLQLYQNRLCMDFSRFHEAIEKVLGRGVWTHEFAYPDLLKAEFEGTRKAPTMEDIINLFPKDKVVIPIVIE